MPRTPDWSQHVSDPRLARYHGWVARLFRDSVEVGLLLVRVEPCATVLSGHLWWRRWSPSWDALWLFTIVDGNFSDMFVPADAVENELRDWDAGRFTYYRETLLLQWTPEDESAHLRHSEFGVDDDTFQTGGER